MDPFILSILPHRVQELLDKLPKHLREGIEEIRIRALRPVEIVGTQFEGFLTKRGNLTQRAEEGMVATLEEVKRIINLISSYSLYAMEEELRRGYITLNGGHRVGLSGKFVLRQGQVSHLKEITGFNFRIAREKKGAGLPFIPYLWDGSRVLNALIISPPQCGKTTILRDLARIFSNGLTEHNIPGQKVCIVDERSELAGAVNGIPQNDIGPRTDILDGCPKAEGMMMSIRSMSPNLLIVDEIGRQEDAEALLEAIHAGVSVITTAHGIDLNDIRRRPTLSKIMEMGIFDRYLILSRRKGAGTLEAIYDQQLKSIYGVRAHA